MKHFTLLTLVAAFILSSSSFAQTDLQLNSFRISSTSGNEVPPNHVTEVSYTIQNTGTVAIPQGAVFIRTVSNGTNPVVGPDNITLNAALAPGDSITYTTSSPYTFTSLAMENVCLSTFLDTSFTETDTLNNIICQQYQVSSAVNVDIAIINTTIVSPNDLDGHDLDNGDEPAPDIGEISFQMVNLGDLAYLANTTYNIDVYIDNDVISGFGNPGQVLNPGDTSGVLSTTEAALIPETPQEVGTHEFCVEYTGGDDVGSNDADCAEFELIDTYVPPPPFGVEEGVNANLKIFASNGNILVTGIIEPIDLTVMDMAGKLVTVQSMNSDGIVPMTETAKGVYMIQATSAINGNTSIYKISVQ